MKLGGLEMRTDAMGWIAAAAAALGWAGAADAAALVLRGRVAAVSGNRIVIRDAGSTIELERGPGDEKLRNLKVGDYITIEYQGEVRRVVPALPAQEPGQIAPDAEPSPSPTPGRLDDRGFYPA